MSNNTANNTPSDHHNLPAIVATPDLSPAQLADFEAQLLADAGDSVDATGFRSNSYTPSLVIVQSNSAMLRPKNEKYVPGAKPGSVIHMGTREVLNQPFYLVPCFYRRYFKEWPQTGGPRTANIDWDEYKALEKADGKASRILPNGNEVVDTGCFSFLLLSPGMEPEEVEINMASTQLDVARAFNKTVAKQRIVVGGKRIKAMPYAFAYECESVLFEGEKNAWYQWRFSNPVQVPPAVYEQAKTFSLDCQFAAEAIEAEVVDGGAGVAGKRADISAGIAAMSGGSAGGTAGGSAGGGDDGSSDLPF